MWYMFQIIQSGEKKFILDGSDGLTSYWRDLRKEHRFLSTRHSDFDKVGLNFITHKMNRLSANAE